MLVEDQLRQVNSPIWHLLDTKALTMNMTFRAVDHLKVKLLCFLQVYNCNNYFNKSLLNIFDFTANYCMYTIIRVTSFGHANCRSPGQPGMNTRVYKYIGWIEPIVWGARESVK